LEPILDKWASFGFETHEVDGHDLNQLRDVLLSGNLSGKPRAVIAKTVKGRGVDFAEHNPIWHHKAKLGAGDIALLRQAIADA
jgi:transketolase